jgi:hypothetical protein
MMLFWKESGSTANSCFLGWKSSRRNRRFRYFSHVLLEEILFTNFGWFGWNHSREKYVNICYSLNFTLKRPYVCIVRAIVNLKEFGYQNLCMENGHH